MKLIKIALMGFAMAMFVACGKEDDGPKTNQKEEQEQDQYDKYVTAEMQTLIDQYEITINRGINPPNVEGYYRISPMIMLKSSYASDDMYLGQRWLMDFKMGFDNQNELNVDVMGYEVRKDSDIANSIHSGKGTFICGTGDDFSIFVPLKIVSSDDKYHGEGLTIISGKMEKNEQGAHTGNIVNVLYATLFTDMDGNPNWVPNNTTRTFNGTVSILTKEQFDKTTKSGAAGGTPSWER